MNIKDKIIADLTWLAEKTEDPIVKITYSMSISIVKMHFENVENKNVQPIEKPLCGVGEKNRN